MRANQATYPIATTCRWLRVSASGYYAWAKRKVSARALADEVLLMRIRAIHDHSRGTYGVPRIHAELAAAQLHVGRKRIARLMRRAGLQGASRRKWIATTVRASDARPARDLVRVRRRPPPASG